MRLTFSIVCDLLTYSLNGGKAKKLTNGYTDQAYGFEVFECLRKIALVGIPVLTDPGSVEQRAFGMVICFFTTCLLSYFNPYVDPGDNFLAVMAQFEIALVLIFAMVLEQMPDNEVVDGLMTASMIFSLLPLLGCAAGERGGCLLS